MDVINKKILVDINIYVFFWIEIYILKILI